MAFKANIRTVRDNKTSVITDGDMIQVTIYHETFELKAEDGMAKHHSKKILSLLADDVDGLTMSHSIGDSIERPRVDDVRVTWDLDMTDYGQNESDKEGHLFVMAHCTVSHKDGEDCRRLSSFSSVGLFDIHPDIFKDEIARVAQEVLELHDLREHLKHYNVDMASYDEQAKDVKSYLHGEKI